MEDSNISKHVLCILTFLLSVTFIGCKGDGCHSNCLCSKNMTVVRCSNLNSLSVSMLPPHTKEFSIIDSSSLGTVFNYSLSSLYELERIDLSNNNIIVLPDIVLKYLGRLKWLSLRNNKMHRIENYLFQFNSNLEHLDLSGNHFIAMPDVPFRFLSHLKVLNISHNRLTSPRLGLRFQGLVNLEMIDFTGNSFEAITEDVFEMTHTWTNRVRRELNFSNCGIHYIADMVFEHLAGLVSISFAGNQDLNIDNLTYALNSSAFIGLRKLDLSFMNLDNIDGILNAIKHVPLKELYVRNNILTEIPSSLSDYQRNLKILHAQNNRLTAIGASVAEISSLQILDMSNNSISTIEQTFGQNLINLRYLSLAQNQIGDGLVRITSMIHLDFLDLSFNLLENFDIPVQMANLRILNLSGNRLTTLKQLIGLEKLETLDFSQNRLSKIIEFMFPDSDRIYEANFSRNVLSQTNHQSFRPNSPKIIDLSVNNLDRIGNLGWENAIEIHLHGNQISTMDRQTFYALYGLEILDLSNNSLSHFESACFVYLRNLTYLSLRKNQLSESSDLERAFMTLESIESVDLSYNNYTKIMADTFKKTKLLRRIKLNENQIRTINPVIFRNLEKLEEVDLSNNYFLCDCDLLEFRDWLRTTKIKLMQKVNSSYICHGPPGRSKALIVNYEIGKFECQQSLLYTIIFSSVGSLCMIVAVIGAMVFKWYYQWRKNLKNSRQDFSMSEYESVHDRDINLEPVKRSRDRKWSPQNCNGYSKGLGNGYLPMSRDSLDYEVEALLNARNKKNIEACSRQRIPLVGLAKEKKEKSKKSQKLVKHKPIINKKHGFRKKGKSKTQEKKMNISEKEVRFRNMYRDYAKRYENYGYGIRPMVDKNGIIVNRMVPYFYDRNGVRRSTAKMLYPPRPLPVPNHRGDIIRYAGPLPEVLPRPPPPRPRYYRSVPDVYHYATMPRRTYPLEPRIHTYQNDRDLQQSSNLNSNYHHRSQKDQYRSMNGDLQHSRSMNGDLHHRSMNGDLRHSKSVNGDLHHRSMINDLRHSSVDIERHGSVGAVYSEDKQPDMFRSSRSENCLAVPQDHKYHTISAKSSREVDPGIKTNWI